MISSFGFLQITTTQSGTPLDGTMIVAYRHNPTHIARSALSIALRSIAHTSGPPHNPLQTAIETDDLGLPLDPLPLPIPKAPSTGISDETWLKLHRLAAINPPPEGSEEEARLKAGLSELVGLMEIVKNVQLPEGDLRTITAELLSEGVGEVVFDGTVAQASTTISGQKDGGQATSATSPAHEKTGRELLEWATRRVGDYYASKVK
ncbi:hypothetical protein DB88DRAFT_484542 [Papiliotrema laurentii]|uniref:Uncharacterized protein n=1 Tax=Papiliotrema laurentii TaxID=5418 RepID=A0AAD9L7K3_PAPLA|nr:hypothetical protein DB88DRAFT_484542 [Papiliotrema laurentii]